MREINCHEEKIHLCGNIQSFGYLFIFEDDKCIAVSENCVAIAGEDYSEILGMTVDDVLHRIVPSFELRGESIEHAVSDSMFARYSDRVAIHANDYFLSLYRYDGKIYLEIEACNPLAVKTTKLYYYAKHLDDRSGGNSC